MRMSSTLMVVAFAALSCGGSHEPAKDACDVNEQGAAASEPSTGGNETSVDADVQSVGDESAGATEQSAGEVQAERGHADAAPTSTQEKAIWNTSRTSPVSYLRSNASTDMP